MKKYICNKNILVRFAWLYIFGLLLFIIAWFLSFYLLPEGVLRDTSFAAKLAGSDVSSSIGKELVRIFAVNLFMGVLIVAFNFSFRINGIPLGYVIPPAWFLLYGLILGSNSFTLALTERVGPSFLVLQRSGLYELAAFTLITVATYNISRFEIKKLFVTNPEKINTSVKLQPQQFIGLIAALLILFFSNLRETLMLLSLN